MAFLFDSVTQLSLDISPAIVEPSWQQSQSLTTPRSGTGILPVFPLVVAKK